MTEPVNQPSATDNKATERTHEVDPDRLVEKDFCLAYEKSSGFEAVTNFKISVGGLVPDSEESVQCPISYILNAHMENFNDDQEEANLKYVYLSNLFRKCWSMDIFHQRNRLLHEVHKGAACESRLPLSALVSPTEKHAPKKVPGSLRACLCRRSNISQIGTGC